MMVAAAQSTSSKVVFEDANFDESMLQDDDGGTNCPSASVHHAASIRSQQVVKGGAMNDQVKGFNDI